MKSIPELSTRWIIAGDSKRLVPLVFLLLARVFKENKQLHVLEANGKEGDWTVKPSRSVRSTAGVIVGPGRESLRTRSLLQLRCQRSGPRERLFEMLGVLVLRLG